VRTDEPWLSLRHLAERIPGESLPEFLGNLRQIECIALARLSTPAQQAKPDELLTVEQTAIRLKCSHDYLYRHAGKLPFTRRQGRALRFSSNAIDRYLLKSQ